MVLYLGIFFGENRMQFLHGLHLSEWFILFQVWDSSIELVLVSYIDIGDDG